MPPSSCKVFAVNTRDLHITRYKHLREIRGEAKCALYLRTARRDRLETRLKPTTITAHMDIRSFTESQTSEALLTRSTRWSDAHHLESQEGQPRTCHRPNTPAGEPGLDLGLLDYTGAAWDVCLHKVLWIVTGISLRLILSMMMYMILMIMCMMYIMMFMRRWTSTTGTPRALRARIGLMIYGKPQSNRTWSGLIPGNSHSPCPCLVVIKQNLKNIASIVEGLYRLKDFIN